MTELITALQEVLGAPPPGAEIIEYMVAALIFLMVCMSAVSMLSGLFKWIGGM